MPGDPPGHFKAADKASLNNEVCPCIKLNLKRVDFVNSLRQFRFSRPFLREVLPERT